MAPFEPPARRRGDGAQRSGPPLLRSAASWADLLETLLEDPEGQEDPRSDGPSAGPRRRQQRPPPIDPVTDPETGLIRRPVFERMLDQALARSRRRRSRAALLYIDVEPWHGQVETATADAILPLVAERLSEVSRASDVLARVGGHSFAILLEDIEDEGAETDGRPVAAVSLVMQRIRTAMDRSFSMGARSVRVSLRIGTSLLQPGWRGSAALSEAERACLALDPGTA